LLTALAEARSWVCKEKKTTVKSSVKTNSITHKSIGTKKIFSYQIKKVQCNHETEVYSLNSVGKALLTSAIKNEKFKIGIYMDHRKKPQNKKGLLGW